VSESYVGLMKDEESETRRRCNKTILHTSWSWSWSCANS